MTTNQGKTEEIPLDEYIARMQITPLPPKSPEHQPAPEPPVNNMVAPKRTKPSQNYPNVSYRCQNNDLVRSRFRQLDARQRILQLQQNRRHRPAGRRFSFEQPLGDVGPSRPSIAPPSSMVRQAVVRSGPSWEQMLPYQQLQEMAASAFLLSTFIQLDPPPPFNDPALFRR